MHSTVVGGMAGRERGGVTYSTKELARAGVPEERVRLRAYRRACRRTAKDVAAIAGVSSQTVLVFERGHSVSRERAIVDAYAALKPIKNYGAECKAFREARGLTQVAAARLSGMDPDTWSQLERRGHSIAPTDELRNKLDTVLPARPLTPWAPVAIRGRQLFKDRLATRKRRAAGKEFGWCLDCRNPAMPGCSRCEKHAIAARTAKARWKAKKQLAKHRVAHPSPPLAAE